MANKFYEIGKAGGEKVTDYSKAIAPALQSMYKQMLDSKEKLDAFMLKSPQGVVMDKVPEQFRSQVTKFLADGKQKYAQAASVLSSGVNSSSQRYMDAVETMNKVQNSFENNANILAAYNANVAKQKPRVDDIQIGTTSAETTDFNNYITGDIFNDAKLDYETGNISYSSSDLTKTDRQQVSEYMVPGQSTDRAGETFSAISTGVMSSKKTGDSWELTSIQLEKDYDRVMNKIQSTGRRELVFSDEDYMQTIITANKADDEEGYEKELMRIMSDPEESKNAIAGYKEHNMTAYKQIFDLTKIPVSKKEELKSKFYDGFVGSQEDFGFYSAELKSTNRKQIKNRKTFGDYDGKRGYYFYDKKTDAYFTKKTVTKKVNGKDVEEEVITPFSVFEMLKKEGLLRDGEFSPASVNKSAASSTSTSTPATPLFDVETIVSKINENIFNQDADDAKNELEAVFENIPGFEVESTERDGVIVKYNNKRVQVPAAKTTNYTSKTDKDALARSKSTLEEWLRTVSIKPTI
tara:strand:+ start:826 stop:2388 length:1563 start_codon:yes stop_codon:yes gene_type:complete